MKVFDKNGASRIVEENVERVEGKNEVGLQTPDQDRCSWREFGKDRLLTCLTVQDTRSGMRRPRLKSLALIVCLIGLISLYTTCGDPHRIRLQLLGRLHLNEILNHDWDGIFDALTRPEEINNDTLEDHRIPQYVLDYAPLVHLYSEEKFWPCDMAEHLLHVTPELDYTPIQARSLNMNLTNLDSLNQYDHGRHVYLTSDDNVEERPDWLGGQKNIPDDFVEESEVDLYKRSRLRLWTKKVSRQTHGGRSDAPAVLVMVEKGRGIIDAFWFYFYSYNLGNQVLNVRFGNHVGDWEHSLIRFQHGKPKLVFFSEHNFGEAYTYKAVEKIGKRPVIYSATGTHAMYATPGSHPYVLPFGILRDETDRGPLWDPTLNSHTYIYNHLTDDLRASNATPHAPIEWFFFNGRWGDKFYPLEDKRQYGFAGENHYVSGPEGPRFKNLGRRKVCQGDYTDPCVIRNRLGANEVKIWPGSGVGEDL